MPGSTIAEHDCLQERRPPQLIDMIDVDIRLEQGFNRFDVSALTGRNQRRPAKTVIDFEIRTGLQRELENFEIAIGACQEQRAIELVVLRVDIAPAAISSLALSIWLCAVAASNGVRLWASRTRTSAPASNSRRMVGTSLCSAATIKAGSSAAFLPWPYTSAAAATNVTHTNPVLCSAVIAHTTRLTSSCRARDHRRCGVPSARSAFPR